ncbi:hypothetical protein LEMLEM_LOCUS20121, partial [Lemmus lemmus]
EEGSESAQPSRHCRHDAATLRDGSRLRAFPRMRTCGFIPGQCGLMDQDALKGCCEHPPKVTLVTQLLTEMNLAHRIHHE